MHRSIATVSLSGTLRHVEHGGRQFTTARDLLVKIVAPIDLHHVEGDQLGVAGAELECRLDHQGVSRTAVETKDGATIDG